MIRFISFSAFVASLAVAIAATMPGNAKGQLRGGRGGARSGGHTAPNIQRPANSGFSASRPAHTGGLAERSGTGNPGGGRTSNLQRPGNSGGIGNPGSSFHRPNVEPSKLPKTVPGIPKPGTTKPGDPRPGGVTRPNASGVARPETRPSPGQLNDFLGLGNGPISGTGPSGAGPIVRPDVTPGNIQRPDSRPTVQRPNIDRDNIGQSGDRFGNRIGDSNRVTVGSVNIGNSVDFSSDRNAWVNNIHNSGNQIRSHAGNRFTGVYANGRYRYGVVGGYPYYAGWTTLGPYYGWRPISYVALGTFIGATWANTTPVYYAYGTGGNVYYENNVVYVNDQPAGTPAEYAAQAAALVAAAPDATDDTEWLPLGVFALTQEGVDDSQTMIELAVNKQGVVAGTYCNEATDVSRALKGTVDKQTQRVAIGFADGKNSSLVLETGVQNLTQDEAPGLLHYGADMSVPVLLVRLEAPADSANH